MEQKLMVKGILVGKVNIPKKPKDAKPDWKPACFVTLDYMGGNYQVINHSPQTPEVGKLIDAVLDGNSSSVSFGSFHTTAFIPKELTAFSYSKG